MPYVKLYRFSETEPQGYRSDKVKVSFWFLFVRWWKMKTRGWVYVELNKDGKAVFIEGPNKLHENH